MNIGIICEYNPFHYGHLYHINKIKELYPNSNIILVLSNWITERGDLNLIDKWKRTDIAINYGVNLVVELPTKYMQSADYFAKGCLEILNKLNCTHIVFGSESNDLDKLTSIANVQLNNKKYDELVKQYCLGDKNYPTAISHALKELLGITVTNPNDLLGVSYIKEIIKNKYKITPITIKRNSNYNSKKIEGKITSATSIRELIKKNCNVREYIPKYSFKHLKSTILLDDYFMYLKYKIICEDDLTIYQGIDINIQNRIKKVINDSNSLDELLERMKNKKYTYNRLKRSLTFILLSITKEYCSNLSLEYIRILGFDSKGKMILNNIKKNITIPLLVNYDKNYLNTEYKINLILSLNNKIKDKKAFIEKEYKQKPIIK